MYCTSRNLEKNCFSPEESMSHLSSVDGRLLNSPGWPDQGRRCWKGTFRQADGQCGEAARVRGGTQS